jgi:hypothetical protein
LRTASGAGESYTALLRCLLEKMKATPLKTAPQIFHSAYK